MNVLQNKFSDYQPIYTNGSKTKEKGTGAAVVTPDANYLYPLNSVLIIFTAETLAILEAIANYIYLSL